MKYLIWGAFLLLNTFALGQSINKEKFTALRQEKDPVKLAAALNQLSNSQQEDDLNTVITYYMMLNQGARFDSLMRVSTQRFPHGRYAYIFTLNHIVEEQNPVKAEDLLHKAMRQFPDHTNPADFERTHLYIAQKFAAHKNTAKALEHLALVKDDRLDISTVAMAFMAYNPQKACDVLSAAIKRLRSNDAVLAIKSGQTLLYNYEMHYSQALIKTNRPDDAVNYAKDAFEHLKPATANEVVISYANALYADKRYAETVPLLGQVVSEGRSTREIEHQLIAAYHKAYPQKSDKVLLDSLNQVLIKNIGTELASKMIDEPAARFTVTDEKGQSVSLDDFKGKTVIVDFWATWCGPCKASFPTMQRAVDHYQNNPDVKFLFVHTREASATPLKDAQQYLRENHYTLPLYLDTKDPKTGKDPAITMFGIQGIPTKLIIDGNGHIRFRFTGFQSGRDTAAEAEIIAMIEMTRKS